MKYYRQKPRVIQAQQYTGGSCKGVCHCDRERHAPHVHGYPDRISMLVVGDWVVKETLHEGYYVMTDAYFKQQGFEAFGENEHPSS